jgi:hypothetical protein
MAKKRESRQLMTLMPNKIGALEELFAKTRSAVSEVEDDQDIGFLNEGPIGVTLDTELDIEALIDEAIADRSLASRDLKFDDSQMPRAKNFLEWCTGRHFLKADPYLEQALIGIRLFGEYCPRCSDVEWMDIDNHEPQEGLEGIRQHVTCMEHGRCPKCGVGRAELLRNKELKFYNELAVNAGQRSGKSILVAMLSSYITHQILKVQRPTEVLGIGDNTILHGTFVALTQKQAMDTLWEPYYGYLLTSPWFQKYHALIREYERKYGVEVMKIRDTFVLYRHRSLVVYPAGPDKRVLRGRTRIFSATDEIGWFDNNEASAKVKTSAREVHIALDRSLLTVRAEEQRQIAADFDLAFTGYNFNISSPSHARDKINELVRLSQGSEKILGLHAPTWKMNPKISQESLSENFKNDPVGTWRDYGAVAPLSANPFITQMDMINDALRDKGRNLVQYNTAIMRAKDGSRTRYATVTNVKATDAPSIMAIDAGYSNNSFALVVGSYDEHMCISADVLVEIMPLPGIPLNYSLIFEHVMKPLFAARNVKVVLADRWQSIKILQDSSPFVEVTRQYSLKYADFWTIKALLEQNTVSLPRPLKVKTVEETLKFPQDEYPLCFEGYPTEHLMLQFATVQDSGSQVLKGTGYTDDLWRALCLMCWGFESTEFDEELTRKAEVKRNRDPSRLGVSKGRSNSSGANLGLSAPTAASSAVLKSRR